MSDDGGRGEVRPQPFDRSRRPDWGADAPRRSSYDDSGRREGPLPEAAAWNLVSYLLAGVLAFGLPGWLLDRWLGTSWLVLVGGVLGAALAFVTIWVRYGTDRS